MSTATKKDEIAIIKPINMVRTTLSIIGTAPFVQHKFSAKAKAGMLEGMALTAAEKKNKGKSERKPRDYDQEFLEAQHISEEGWHGIPATGLRCAMIDACRTVGMVMTRAKMAVFVVAEGIDREDGSPLIRLLSPHPPERHTGLVRLESGVADVRVRPMWRTWGAKVTLEYDADMISGESVINLLERAGRQVGIGEGRPFSKNSVGQGWGTFTLETE